MSDCKTTLPDGRKVTREEFIAELEATQNRVIAEIDDPDSTLIKPNAIVPPYRDPPSGPTVVNMDDMTDGIVGAGYVEKATRKLAPDLILAQSTSKVARAFAKSAFKSSFFRENELKGVATDTAEMAIKQRMAKNSLLVNDIERAARNAVKDKSYTSKKEFNKAVWDTATGGGSRSGPVGEIAGRVRNEVFLPLLDELKAAKIIDEPQATNSRFIMNYVTRMYDTPKISQQRLKFKQEKIKPWLEQKILTRIATIEESTQTAAKKLEELTKARKDFDDIERIADETINNMIGMKRDTPFASTVSGSSAFKGRVVDIPDAELKDWLITDDMGYLVSRYMSNAARALEMDKLYKSFGVKNRDEIAQKIQDEYTELTTKATDEKAIVKLQKEMRSDLANLNTAIDRLTGISHGDPMSMTNRVIRSVKAFNFVTSLGQMTISAIPDVAQVFSMPSIGGTKAIKQLGKFAGALFGDRKLRTQILARKDQARQAIGLLDLQRGNRTQSLGDVFDEAPNVSKIEQGLGYLSEKFGKFTLMDYWNDSAKLFSAMLTSDLITDNVAKLVSGKASKTLTRDLANIGIAKSQAGEILEQMTKFPPDAIGKLQKTELWDDRVLDIMNRAILKAAEDAVITPGVAQIIRLSTDNLYGQLFFQFKSFMIASNSSILIRGIQRRDANALGGLITAIALGAMVEYLKDTIAGRDSPEDATAWLLAGVQNSGAMAAPAELVNIIDKVSGGRISLARAAGLDEGSKFRNRGVANMLLGPTAGKIESAAGLGNGLIEGEFDDNEQRKMKALAPYANLAYVNYLFTLTNDEDK